MDEERICALCEETLEEDDEGHLLEDGRLVCDSCFEYSCGQCDSCGGYFEEDHKSYIISYHDICTYFMRGSRGIYETCRGSGI